MVLLEGNSEDVIIRNISQLIKEGHPCEQAIALSLQKIGSNSLSEYEKFDKLFSKNTE